MSENKLSLHYVCTIEEAQKLIKGHNRFWVSNCGCREGKGSNCRRSRIDVCLQFHNKTAASGTGMKEISKEEVLDLLRESMDKNLVPRPFRDYETKKITEGICFCCDDCCGYFLNDDEVCDKGEMVVHTDLSSCVHCGACVGYCYFNARIMNGDKHEFDIEKCYGCGLCVSKCPAGCISLDKRKML